MFKALFLVFVAGFLFTPSLQPADTPMVSGFWSFVFDTQGGDRESKSILEQDGEKVTGRWEVDEKKQGGDAITGTFINKELSLTFKHNSEIGPGTLKIKGRMADDGTMSGDWAFEDYSGSFKAAKIKDAAK